MGLYFSEADLQNVSNQLNIGKNPSSFSPEQKNDKKIAELFVRRNGMWLQHCGPDARADKEIVLIAVNGNENSWIFADDSVKFLPEIIISVFHKNTKGADGMGAFVVKQKNYSIIRKNLLDTFKKKIQDAKTEKDVNQLVEDFKFFTECLKSVFEKETALIEKRNSGLAEISKIEEATR